MDNDFQKFVIESTHLQEEALAHQIKISEEANRYSSWFLGIGTAGMAILIARFDVIIETTWISKIYAPYVLILAGVTLLVSVFLGILHHYMSLKEISQSRVLIALFGVQKLIPFFNHPAYPKNVPADMHIQISNGALLNPEQLEKFKISREKAKNLRNRQAKVLKIQQILTGIGYVLLFVNSIHF